MKAETGRFLLLVALATLSGVPRGVLSAQESRYGVVVLNVKDITGGTVWGAAVVIVPSTSAIPRVLTTETGDFPAVELAEGIYSVTVRAQGFRQVTKSIEVTSNNRLTVEATLMPGSCPPGPCFTVTVPPGFTAKTPLPGSFPSQSQYESSDWRYSIIGVDRDSEPKHTLFLLDRTRTEGRMLFSYDQRVSVLWNFDSKSFAVTDYAADGSSHCRILSVDEKNLPVQISDLLLHQETGSRARTLRRHLTNEHLTVEALQWRGRNNLLVEISGRGRGDPNGFAEVYAVDAYAWGK